MGRIKELREKIAKGEATEEEVTELEELESEAVEADEEQTEEVSTEEEVDKLAESLVEKASGKLESKLDKVLHALEDKAPRAYVSAPNYIVDKKLGKVGVSELDQIRVEIPGRKQAGKQVTEVTAKTTHFLSALLTGDKQKLQLLTEGTTTAGGFLVPEEFANLIVEDKRDLTVMRQLATVMTTTTDTFHLPSLDTRPVANFRSEAAVKSTSTVQWAENVFTPFSLAVIVGLSQELVADASLGVNGDIAGYVARLMARSIAEREERAFWTGNGTGQPTGITNYTFGSVDAGGTDSALADAVKRTFARLPQGYRAQSVWVMNQQALERVLIAKDSQNNYLLERLADSPQYRLMGRPVFEQNDLPTDQIFFGDFSLYHIVDRQGITVDYSTEATVASQSAFERNLVFVRAESRVDGELVYTRAIRQITGLN